MTEDFYDLLGVDRDASQEEIRKAFRGRVREYHPDLNDDPRAPAQFTALKKAYDTLGSPEERNAYDRMGHDEYVTKRISGLPSPDQWRIPNERGEAANGDRTTGSDGATTDAGVSAGGNGTADRESTATAGDARTGGSASTGASRDRSDDAERSDPRSRGRPGNGASRSSGATGGREGDAAATGASASSTGRSSTRSSRAADPGTTASATGSSTTRGPTGGPVGSRSSRSTEPARGTLRDRIERVKQASLGWPLIAFADGLYLAGLTLFAIANLEGLELLYDRIGAEGWTLDGVWTALGSRSGIQTLPAFVQNDVTDGTVFGGVLVIAGMAALPSVYFFIIRETRATRTPWRPSYLFGVAALAPAVGLVVDLSVATGGLYLDAFAYVLLPVVAIAGLPASAFVRPRVKRFLRKHYRRLRDR